MALPKPLTLPAGTLARLVDLEGLGEPHLVLKPLAVWRPAEDRNSVNEVIRTELAAMGLFDRRGRLDVEVAASLAVLCRPATEFYGWIHRDGRTISVLAAAIGGEGILAVRDGELVRLRQVRPSALAEALVRHTAEVPPGRGDAVTFVRSESATAVEGRQLSDVGASSVAASREIRLAHRIASQPTTGGGQLSVACRNRLGPRRVSEHPLRYADTPNGRWLNLTESLPDGDNRILLAPVSTSGLAARLRQMHDALNAPDRYV